MSRQVDVWKTSLRKTWRLPGETTRGLRPFLAADGLHRDEVLAALPYESQRAREPTGTVPDPRRYRDLRQVCTMSGLAYEDADGRLRVTDLGWTAHRWIDVVTERNRAVLARPAARALSLCQLDAGPGGPDYLSTMSVRPFAFIWEAMLKLENRISSDELLRTVFRVRDHAELQDAIEMIRRSRESDDVSMLGSPVETDFDRAIPWMSLASFGWTLMDDKKSGKSGDYELHEPAIPAIRVALLNRPRHRTFGSDREYTQYISDGAALPP